MLTINNRFYRLLIENTNFISIWKILIFVFFSRLLVLLTNLIMTNQVIWFLSSILFFSSPFLQAPKGNSSLPIFLRVSILFSGSIEENTSPSGLPLTVPSISVSFSPVLKLSFHAFVFPLLPTCVNQCYWLVFLQFCFTQIEKFENKTVELRVKNSLHILNNIQIYAFEYYLFQKSDPKRF